MSINNYKNEVDELSSFFRYLDLNYSVVGNLKDLKKFDAEKFDVIETNCQAVFLRCIRCHDLKFNKKEWYSIVRHGLSVGKDKWFCSKCHGVWNDFMLEKNFSSEAVFNEWLKHIEEKLTQNYQTTGSRGEAFIVTEKRPLEVTEALLNTITVADSHRLRRLVKAGVASQDWKAFSQREMAFDLATRALYSQLSEKLHIDTLVITGHVMGDGLGDFFSMLKTATTLTTAFPNLKIKVMAHSNDIERLQRVVPEIPFSVTFFTDLKELKTALKEQPCALEIAFPIYTVTDRPSHIYLLTEYGCRSEMAHRPPVMGLEPHQEGIFINPPTNQTSELSLEDDFINQRLFGTTRPSQEEMKAYFADHQLYFGHIPKSMGQQLSFIYTILTQTQQRAQDLTLCIAVDDNRTKLGELLDHSFLKECGIKKIISHQKSSSQQEPLEIDIQESGKTVTLINPFPLNHRDISQLLHCSEPLKGCTGDLSFSETIAEGIPFYDIKQHKYDFFSSYTKLVKEILGEESVLYQFVSSFKRHYKKINYFNYSTLPLEEQRRLPVDIARENGSLLVSPDFQEQATRVHHYIAENLSLATVLPAITTRLMAHISFPELERLERYLRGDFQIGIKSLEEVRETLQKAITEIQAGRSLQLEAKHLTCGICNEHDDYKALPIFWPTSSTLLAHKSCWKEIRPAEQIVISELKEKLGRWSAVNDTHELMIAEFHQLYPNRTVKQICHELGETEAMHLFQKLSHEAQQSRKRADSNVKR